jgi:hypothetical protein
MYELYATGIRICETPCNPTVSVLLDLSVSKGCMLPYARTSAPNCEWLRHQGLIISFYQILSIK